MNAADILSVFRLDGQLALVTGASSGLGRRAATTLAAAGARVIVTARDTGRLHDVVEDIARSGGEAFPHALNVDDGASVKALFAELEAGVGLPGIVINNAGVSVHKPLLEHDEADWDQVMNTNLKGAWLVATEAARRLVAAGRPGSIVNVASILGQRVTGGVAAYAISKAALLQATRTMALELARYDIRVNALLPGYVVTDLNREFLASAAGDKLRLRIPSRRFGVPGDLDGPLLLLASDAGRGMSGSLVAVDGGHLVSAL